MKNKTKQWFIEKIEWLVGKLLGCYYRVILESYILNDWAHKTFRRRHYKKQQEIDNLSCMRERELLEMGTALGVLLHDLPRKLQDCESLFIDWKLVDGKLKKEALRQVSYYDIDLGVDTTEIVERGLIAERLFKTFSAVSHVVSGQDKPFTIVIADSMREFILRDKDFFWLTVIFEIQKYCLVDETTAFKLFNWCMAVSSYKPYVFPGFKVESSDEGKAFVFVPTDKKFENLVHTWLPSEIMEFI